MRGEGEQADDTADWGELLRDGRALYSVLILLGTILHAVQTLVITIIMPTVVGDIGGGEYYTWPAMLYIVGSIIGSSSVGAIWRKLGQRRGYSISAFTFLVGTTGCALAPDIMILNGMRLVQGYAGGMLVGGGMILIGTLFKPGQRKRLLAAHQGTWTVAQLMGPALGGAFAEIGWWRGSFWVMIPIILGFAILAWIKLPRIDEQSGPLQDASEGPTLWGNSPLVRLGILAAGVFTLALVGPIKDDALRSILLLVSAGSVWLAFHLDAKATSKLYPSQVLSVRSPVGLAMWILFAGGMLQTSVALFLPLLLQVVHGVQPIFISFVSIIISLGWTFATFAVSGWSGVKEKRALICGPLFMIAGVAGLTFTAQHPYLAIMAIAALVQGLGLGLHNALLISRTMANSRPGEERITSAAMPSIRALGTAFGAAIAGVLSTFAGLGDAQDPAAVGHAVAIVYGVNLLPLGIATIFMILLVRTVPVPAR
jgi:MFS family permease